MKMFLYFVMGILSLIGSGSLVFVSWANYNADQKYYALVEHICYQHGKQTEGCMVSEPDKGLYRNMVYIPNRSMVYILATEAWEAENLKPNSSMRRMNFYLAIRQKELETDVKHKQQPVLPIKRNKFYEI